jgi:hypothetical protein
MHPQPFCSMSTHKGEGARALLDDTVNTSVHVESVQDGMLSCVMRRFAPLVHTHTYLHTSVALTLFPWLARITCLVVFSLSIRITNNPPPLITLRYALLLVIDKHPLEPFVHLVAVHNQKVCKSLFAKVTRSCGVSIRHVIVVATAV